MYRMVSLWALVLVPAVGVIQSVGAQQFNVVATGTLPGNTIVSGTILANSANFADLVTLALQNPGSGAAAAEGAFLGNRPWSYQISGFGTSNSFSFGSTDASNTIVFNYPRLGISQSFTGATRSDSYQQLLAFLRTLNVTDAAISGPKAPTNPVAGNPGSLSAMLTRQSYGIGGTGAGGGVGGSIGTVGSISSNISGLGSGYQSIRQGGSTTRVLDVPLSWTVRSDIDPRRALIISAPLAQADVDGVKVNYYGLGVGYRIPVGDHWSLTPSLLYGGMSSSELNVKSSLISTAVTSAYTLDLAGESQLVIRNMAGYYTTLNYTSLGVSDGKINNTVLKNGLLYSRPASMRNVRFAVEYSVVDTRLFGTETFNRGYTEFGIAMASRQSEVARDVVRFGASYLYSQTSRGFGLNFGYWF